MAQRVEQSRKFPWALTVLIVILVIAAATVLYMYNQSLQFIETDNATLSADQVTVSSTQAGKLTEWTVQNGSKVNKNDRLGTEKLIASAQGTQTSPKADANNTSKAIQSPIDGTVIQTNLKNNQTVSQGQPLAVIADLSKVYVVAYIDEDDVKDVSVGKDVDVMIDAYPNQTFSGKVDQVGSSAGKFVQGSNSVVTSGSDKKEVQRVPIKISLQDFSVDRPVIGLNATVKIHK
jgi:multidrug resistance efflux pump